MKKQVMNTNLLKIYDDVDSEAFHKWLLEKDLVLQDLAYILASAYITDREEAKKYIPTRGSIVTRFLVGIYEEQLFRFLLYSIIIYLIWRLAIYIVWR